MKITCEHCGSTINIESDKVCPSCSAPYHNNTEFKRLKSMHMRDKELNLEMKETINERVKTFGKKVPFFFIIPTIIFVFAFGMIIFTIVNGIKTQKERSEHQNIINQEQAKKDVEVILDEPLSGSSKNWEIKLDSYIIEKFSDETNKTITFHFIVRSKKNDLEILPEIHCLVDDVSVNEDWFSSVDNGQLPNAVHDDIAVQGYISYKMPADTKDVVISFDGIRLNVSL